MEKTLEILSQNQFVKDSSDQEFVKDVIEVSADTPVIVDFWAPWCGPCKTLGPALESEVQAAKGAVKLVKIDIDKNPAVAGQLRVQSIPAVFAFANGQPVDGFMGAQSPAQVKDFVKKLIQTHGGKESGLDQALQAAKEMLENKDLAGAKETFEAIIGEDPNLPEAHQGLIQTNIALTDFEAAKHNISKIPESLLSNSLIQSVIAQTKLAEQSSEAGEVEDLRKNLTASPNDLSIKFELSTALAANNNFEEAIELLLEMFKESPDWENGKSKPQLLQLLDSLGPTNELAKKGRRKLTSLIFT